MEYDQDDSLSTLFKFEVALLTKMLKIIIEASKQKVKIKDLQLV